MSYMELTPPCDDIFVHLEPNSVPFTFGTSLQETRSVKEFLDLLKAIIISANFHLRCRIVILLTLREPFALENILLVRWGDPEVWLMFRRAATLLLRGLSITGSPEGGQPQPDNSKKIAGFKSRLIARDKGCVVCMAQTQDDDDSMYLYDVSSKMFVGAHIFPLQYYDLWDKKGYSEIVVNPYSSPGANRQNTDTRRMNSIDNGLLLCVTHHVQFDAQLSSIHPDTHIVTSFHPRTRYINGLTITQPWSSISRWMMATSEEEDEDEDEDEDSPEDRDEIME